MSKPANLLLLVPPMPCLRYQPLFLTSTIRIFARQRTGLRYGKASVQLSAGLPFPGIQMGCICSMFMSMRLV